MLLVASGPSLVLCSDTGFLFTQLSCLSSPLPGVEGGTNSRAFAGICHESMCTKDRVGPFILLRHSVFGVFFPPIKLPVRERPPPLSPGCETPSVVSRCGLGSIVKGDSDGAASARCLAMQSPWAGHRSG